MILDLGVVLLRFGSSFHSTKYTSSGAILLCMLMVNVILICWEDNFRESMSCLLHSIKVHYFH